ncbi:MAG: hypothetical protein ACE5O2_13700 [Armatimonadota bacterium]
MSAAPAGGLEPKMDEPNAGVKYTVSHPCLRNGSVSQEHAGNDNGKG